jgi:adenylate cyclase
VTLVLICGLIIAYMSISSQRIAGGLLSERAVATLSRNREILDSFFKEQSLAFTAVATGTKHGRVQLDEDGISLYRALFPGGTYLRLGPSPVPQPAPAKPLVWTGFEYDPDLQTAVLRAEEDLGNGQILMALYPRSVFEALADRMRRKATQKPFVLVDRTTALAITGVDATAFAGTLGAPLPRLRQLTSTPLHNLWADQPGSHVMTGVARGRVFPAAGGMYTAVYDEIREGPAKGWVIGMLYRAEEFGSAFEKSRLILIAAGFALLIGAAISFAVGRMLGRPLTRLAQAAGHIHNLDIDAVEPLPGSRLAELDDVNSAFNGTLGALSAFARYVPRELVRRLIAEGLTDPHQSEIRDMTIVFTDLAGFTSLASHLSAEETATYLNRYFETVSDAITKEKGTIDKYIGDGVMAFWGAPSDQPDHAEHAVASVKALAEYVSSSDTTGMRLRIGVHTGKVVVGNFGSSSRMNYTVIGDAVNVAARLQEYGKTVDPDAQVIILASGETVSRLKGKYQADSIGNIPLRGREQATAVFRIA